MSTATVLSAIYGEYEQPKEPTEQSVPIERWIMVTDDKDLDAPGWEVIYEPRPHVHPNVAAKVPKYRPDYYSDSQFTLWIDSSAVFGPRLVETAMEVAWEADSKIAQFRHPHRDDLLHEAELSLTLRKYDGLPMMRQVEHYLAQGMPRHYGLWATGCIGRWRRAAHWKWGDDWMYETVRWGYQDQLSHPYVCWKHDMKPGEMPDTLFTSPHVQFHPHLAARGNG